MRDHWRIQFFVLFVVTLLSAQLAIADELTLKSPKDWARLFQECESDWATYDGELGRLRTSVKREIDKMTEQAYVERWKADDPMIRFARIHWPSIFAEKDSGWQFYKNCSDLNWEVRKSLGSSSDTKEQKLKRVETFQGCVGSMFSRDRKPPPPFDSLVACYRVHANRP